MKDLFSGMQVRENRADVGRSNMGIGLSVCQTIVKAHGGDLRIGTSPGGGAQFSFQLEMEDNTDVEQ